MRSACLFCESCHHEIEVDAITKRHIGTFCPVCDDPMFTEGHWRSYQRLRVWKWVSTALGWLIFWKKPRIYKITVRENSLEIGE